jgi:1A family penicillin-binding protein
VLRIAAGLGTVLVLALVVLVLLANRAIDRHLADREFPPVRILSAPFALRPGVDVAGAKLEARLERLGYEEIGGGAVRPGTFRRARGAIDLGLRGFRDAFADVAPASVRLELDGTVVRAVRALGGGGRGDALLEPELVGTYTGGVTEGRHPVVLADLPPAAVQAVLAAEDARFRSHFGIDPIGLVRAAWVNLRGGEIRQGGSTITQQLAKNLFLSADRTWARKLHEAIYAVLLEARLSKDEILESYLNTIYLGRIGSIGIYGLGAGARAFFGMPARDLGPAEAATLAGLIRAPNVHSPIRHPKRAIARRNQVLAAMLDNGWLDETRHAEAVKRPLGISTQETMRPLEAAFFVDEVLRRVGELGHSPFLVRGLSVYTTLDLELQRAAERALRSGLAALEKRHPKLAERGRIEGAAVTLDAESGFTRAMVGGRDFSQSQYNRATRARRQPGSAFKPFVYLAAIDAPELGITAATKLRDEPIEIRVGPDLWRPANYDGTFLGEVTVRRALEGSRNVPTVELAQRIGIRRVVELARSAGLGDVPAVPAVVLGSGETSLVDLVGAYTVFPKQGEIVRPALIRAVVGPEADVLYRDHLRSFRVATSPAAYVVSTMLEGVVARGTAASLRRLGVEGAVAGKTGTTNDEKDAWFVGYSPELVAGVWVGFDDGSPIGLTGASGALPIWAALMKESMPTYAFRPFPIPPGVVFRDVDPVSGLLGGWMCPDTVREVFVIGTAPTERCGGLADGRPPSEREPLPQWPDVAPTPGPRPPSGWNGVESWIKGIFGGR